MLLAGSFGLGAGRGAGLGAGLGAGMSSGTSTQFGASPGMGGTTMQGLFSSHSCMSVFICSSGFPPEGDFSPKLHPKTGAAQMMKVRF